jgi:hypothetical protein
MRNLIWLFLFVVSTAAIAAAPTTSYMWNDDGANPPDFSSPDAACRGTASQQFFQANYQYTGAVVSGTLYGYPRYVCGYNRPQYGDSVTTGSIVVRSVVTACADGSAPDTSKPTAQQCPDPAPTCTAGQIVTSTFQRGTINNATGAEVDPGGPFPTAIGGCAVEVESVIRCWSNRADTAAVVPTYCTFRFKQTGAVASGSSAEPSAASPTADSSPQPVPPTSVGQGKSCPAGTVNIGTDTDGGAICAGSGTSPKTPTTTTTTPPPTTTTNSDGSTTKTETTQSQNPDGSVTTKTTTTTTGTDGTVTTKTDVTTGNNAAGGAGAASPDPSKDDLCVQHPELNVCKNSTVDGSCESTSCTGDAIQCAILRDQSKRNCDDKAAEDAVKGGAEYGLGNSVLNGNDPAAGTLPTVNNAPTVTMPSSLDSSGWLGGGSCFPDKQFSVQGHAITISFTSACQPLLVFRYALMVVSLLLSFRMLSGVIFRS